MKHVLVVDDSPQIRERVLALLAESTQIRIVGQAADEQEALQIMGRQRPDTVILDIGLAGSSGIDLLKEIKALYPKVKVIMLTNFDSVTYRQKCQQLGADGFLNKSLEFEKVVDMILENSAL